MTNLHLVQLKATTVYMKATSSYGLVELCMIKYIKNIAAVVLAPNLQVIERMNHGYEPTTTRLDPAYGVEFMEHLYLGH